MNPSNTTSERPARVLVVDAVRGLAVICMIQWHCADAWIGGPIREGDVFARLRIVGGLAAPLFLLLAGVSSGLTFRPAAFGASIRRALTIVVMGYALKLFSWVVGYGAILERRNWAAIALDTAALGLGWWGLREKRTAGGRVIALAIAALCFVGTWITLSGTTRSPSVVLRLDVLHGIGAALIVTVAVLLLAHRTRWPALVVLVAGLSVAITTPSFYGADLSFVPPHVLDYIARTVSDPAASGARFPLFPWAGYSLVGAAIGAAVRVRPVTDPWALPFTSHAWLVSIVALAIAALVYEPSTTAQWILLHGEQPRNLLRLLFNTSIAAAMAATSAIVLPRVKPIADALLALGRHSLVIYGVHLEFAYGLIAIPIHQTLGFAGWAFGVTVLGLAMVLLARGLDAYDARERKRTTPPAVAVPT